MPEVFDASKAKQQENPTEPPMSKTESILERTREFIEEKLSPLETVDSYSSMMRNEKPSTSPFDAFAPKPLTVRSFDSQLQDEQVLLLLRQHPITQISKVLVIIGMLIFPFFFPYVDFFVELPGRFQTAVFLLWYLLTMAYTLEGFLSWFFNAYIVTDERIIDIDFISLIYKNISAAKIDNIEDVTATTGGALQSVFNFGTVKVQTAAATTEFEFENVPQPNKVTQFLNELLLQEEKEKIEGRVK
jgi:hypothetical protein